MAKITKLPKSLINDFYRPGRPVEKLWIPPKIDINNLPPIDDPENFCRNYRKAQDSFIIPQGKLGGLPFLPTEWMFRAEWELWGTRKPDGTRQYENVFVFIPKKNAKSPWLARMALHMLLFDGEYEPIILCAAANSEQAGNVWDPMVQAIEKSMVEDANGNQYSVFPNLGKYLRPYLANPQYIRCFQTPVFDKNPGGKNLGGKILRMTGVPNAKQGKNPSCIIIDEIGEWKGRAGHELYSTLTSHSTDAREQPLTIVATTANIYDAESVYQDVKKEAMDAISNPELYPWILPIMYFPTPAEEKAIRAGHFPDDELIKRLNPGHDEVMPFERIKRKLWTGWNSKIEQKKRDALRYRLNCDISSIFNWMPHELWGACNLGPVNPDELMDRPVYVGVDCASVNDCSAWVAIFPPPEGEDGITHVYARVYLPSVRVEIAEGKRDLDKDGKPKPVPRDKAQYIEWEKQGLLTIVPGKVNDNKKLLGDLVRFLNYFKEVDGKKLYRDVRIIAFDPAHAPDIEPTCDEWGWQSARISNSYVNYAGSTTQLMKDVENEKINHGGNDAIAHHMMNLAMKENEKGEIKPIRHRSGEKIDIAMAFLMAYLAWYHGRDDGYSGEVITV